MDTPTPSDCTCLICLLAVDKMSAIACALVLLGDSAEKYAKLGTPCPDSERRTLLTHVWRLLERGGFSDEEAHRLVCDLR